MHVLRILPLLLALILTFGAVFPAGAADMGVSKADFIKRFNAQGNQAGLPALPAKPMQEDKKQDGVGPLTISVHAIGTLVVMLQTYDDKPDAVASLALFNQIGGPPENDVATMIAVDSVFAALMPKMQAKDRAEVKNALGLGKGVQGAVADGKKRERTVGNIRFVSGSREGSLTLAAYPAKR